VVFVIALEHSSHRIPLGVKMSLVRIQSARLRFPNDFPSRSELFFGLVLSIGPTAGLVLSPTAFMGIFIRSVAAGASCCWSSSTNRWDRLREPVSHENCLHSME
jgi:hypothetical protein